MLRHFGKRLVYLLGMPVRVYRACLELLIAIRQFLDQRRRHLAVVVIVAMMTVVGVKLRYTGFADASPVEYLADALPDLETMQEAAEGVTGSEARADSLPSPSAAAIEAEPVIRERSNVPVSVVSAPAIHGEGPFRERTLILPMPMVVAPPAATEPATTPTISERPSPTKALDAAKPPPTAVARLTGEIEADAVSGPALSVPTPEAGSREATAEDP